MKTTLKLLACSTRNRRLIVSALFCALHCARSPFAVAETRLDKGLYAADVGVRTLDATSTNRLLNSPCQCFAESDPMAPGAKSLLALVGYQYGFAFGTISASKILQTHHHPRLGRVLLAADILSEAYAVQHNMRLTPPLASHHQPAF
jgi:hypothetical protein